MEWTFRHDPDSEWVGISESGVETFSARPVVSLGREIIQNSLDVIRDKEQPLLVSFDAFDLKPSEIPGFRGLIEKIEASLKDTKNAGHEKTSSVLQEALELAKKQTVKCLKISERNTVGMAGPHDSVDSPFYSYTKAVGDSNKNTTGLGSFGIGKMATIANSKLRAVLLSTKYQNDEGVTLSLATGMAFWVTHRDSNGHHYKGKGIWGNDGSPIQRDEDLPKWMRRDDLGTDFIILGFEASKNWDKVLTGSLISSFFSAFNEGTLEVQIGDHIRIDKVSIRELLASAKLRQEIKLAERDDLEEEVELAYNFYRCLTEETSIRELTQVQPPIGKVKVKILVEDGLPKKVGFIRQGMFITTADASKIKGLVRFPDSHDFIAVAEVENEDGNKVIRSMEPPQHDRLEGLRIKDGERILKRMGDAIRNQILKHTKMETDESNELEFTADLFGDDLDESRDSEKGAIEVDPEGAPIVTKKTIKVRTPRISSPLFEDTGDSGGEGSVGTGSTSSDGGDSGTGQGGDGDRSGGSGGPGDNPTPSRIYVHGFRAKYLNANEKGKFQRVQVHFDFPEYIGELVCKFYASGAFKDDLLRVKSTSLGDLYDNGIKFRCTRGMRYTAELEFENADGAAILVTAYAL
jgi:hypothetical protein